MSSWLNEEEGNRASLLRARQRTGYAVVMRGVDVLLALLALLPLALPLLLLRRCWHSEWRQGRRGRIFDRYSLALPASRTGRLLARCGAAHWPLLLNVLRGDLAWVGPRARPCEESLPRALAALRPGLINPWFIRRRTAVDFGSEVQCDAHYLQHRGLRHDLGLLLRGLLVALLPRPAGRSAPQRVQVGDVVFDNLSMSEALARLRELLDGAQAQQVSFVNPACVNIAASHRGYRRALARAALVLPDGIGIKIGSDLLGTPLKQNVNGTDLFPRLCDMLQLRGSSVFLLGGQPGVAEQVAAEIARRWPGLAVKGLRNGYFSVAEEGQVAAQVRASGAEVLLVARGVPGQDLFIDRHLPLLGPKLAIGVGGLFDFVSGRISRAPLWMRETGLEWVWRLLQEPGRMWRRYLLGNFSFLARVLLQRLGLRRPARDLRVPGEGVRRGPAVRAVIFATQRASTDLPVADDFPAALLPLGSQTVIERLMAQLALAAVPEVDLVVSDQPEALRALLGDGSRWGLRLKWHMAKDSERPYALLPTLLDSGAKRVLIGHVCRCPEAAALARLAEAEALWVDTGVSGSLRWSGWASVAPAALTGITACMGQAALGQHLRRQLQATRLCEPADGDGLPLDSALRLSQAQLYAPGGLQEAPASWRRYSWGAASPNAQVDEGATLIGPVLIGPGCIVERGAQLGPGVVLTRDVLLSSQSRVEHSLVLPGSYIGSGLDLNGCIVNGARVHHLSLGVETHLAEADALMLSLHDGSSREWSWLGRAIALLILPLLLPMLGLHALAARLGWTRLAWQSRRAVRGRDAQTRALHLATVRFPMEPMTPWRRLLALAAGVLDVAAGERCWFGMRPRTAGQWYGLRHEWQRVLSGSGIGLLHAPCWDAESEVQAEVSAAADVYAAVLTPLQRLVLLLKVGREQLSLGGR